MTLIDPWRLEATIRQTQRLLHSFRRWTGRDLILLQGTTLEQAQALFAAPCVVLAHGTEADPILNYGNYAALQLWELDWEAFIHLPSRLTAEPQQREERARILAEVAVRGFTEGYRGVRISHTGRHFWIERATVWNILDEEGGPAGQAAMFDTWRYLD